MHYSVKRGIATACRPSVCPSVMLVDQDHIGWKSWKLIARISPTSSLFVAQGSSTYSQGNVGKFLGDKVGWGKVLCWSTKATISLKRVKIEEKLLWRVYRNSQTLFRVVPSPTPYGLLFPEIGGSQPHPKLQSLLFQERVKLWTANLAGTFMVSL